MIVFEKGGSARNTRMSNDHLYIRNITRVSPGVFRFHVKEDCVPRMKGLVVGNWVSYGFNKDNLTAAVVAAKDKSPSTYAQIAANRVENITFEKLDFFGSLNGGIRVSDMPGDVTLREVRIIRKPGTRNLLSTPSDALHLMNIRGRLLIENCCIEAPGDDCLNVGTLMERIVESSKDDPKAMTLCTTDNRYYYYTINKEDQLQFLDTKTKREIEIATVGQVEFDPRRRSHRVVIDRKLPDFDPATVLVLNLNQMTSTTVIRNNVMRPYMRNAECGTSATRLDSERRLRIKILENAQNSDNPASSMRPRVRYAAANGETEFVVPHVNCTTSNIGTDDSSTRFRCVDVKFQNIKFATSGWGR